MPTLRLLLLACLLLAPLPARAAEPAPGDLSPDGVPQRLVLALDGIPHEVFVAMQQRGELARFRPAARMISTFPSLSDVAFAQIEGGEPPPGYQVTRYDPQTN